MRAPRLIYDVISFSSGNHGLVCERAPADRPPFWFRLRWPDWAHAGDDISQSATQKSVGVLQLPDRN